MKTDCRREFHEAIKDSARNTKGFKLEHFENKDFAKRIANAAEKSREIYKVYVVKSREERERRREEVERQRKAEVEEKLATERAEFEQSLANYETRADEIIALCAEIDGVTTVLREKDYAYMADREVDYACSTSKEDMLKEADANRAKWAEVEVYGPGLMRAYGYNTPYTNTFGLGTTEGLEYILGQLQDKLASLKILLER